MMTKVHHHNNNGFEKPSSSIQSTKLTSTCDEKPSDFWGKYDNFEKDAQLKEEIRQFWKSTDPEEEINAFQKLILRLFEVPNVPESEELLLQFFEKIHENRAPKLTNQKLRIFQLLQKSLAMKLIKESNSEHIGSAWANKLEALYELYSNSIFTHLNKLKREDLLQDFVAQQKDFQNYIIQSHTLRWEDQEKILLFWARYLKLYLKIWSDNSMRENLEEILYAEADIVYQKVNALVDGAFETGATEGTSEIYVEFLNCFGAHTTDVKLKEEILRCRQQIENPILRMARSISPLPYPTKDIDPCGIRSQDQQLIPAILYKLPIPNPKNIVNYLPIGKHLSGIKSNIQSGVTSVSNKIPQVCGQAVAAPKKLISNVFRKQQEKF
ncbi:hypothetical protein CROQUDRAFT_725718 [Cronartium quercuum f. sp. fusiforme G11]|uniref:Uncharacterized protein n=1 Tax=Cronartium quercuum f. sp. fusiforme G11 TaxID=708437 RepID=A0A9P6T6R3_9BASI|nr:hypothetical protein CROQUDRAFT_725718 [Cronartium quercuum f. sp. fusiforme G11]